MIRIASDFFIPVFGSELIKDFETATAEPEIEDIYTNLHMLKFPNVSYSPCNAYKDHTIQQIVRYTDIPYNKYDVEDKTKLHEIWKDIYKHCIE